MSTPSQPTLSDELKRRKDEADVLKAEADAQKAAAEARKAAIEADKTAAGAERERITALAPDLTKIKESTLELKDSTPMWGSFLTYAALRTVAEDVAERLLDELPDARAGWRLLVTSDSDLATSDATYHDVITGLQQLVTAADKLLEDLAVEFVVEVGAALAAALPGVLSLLSAHRTVSVAPTTPTDIAAAVAVAGELKRQAPEASIVHDDFRLVPDGEVYHRMGEVSERRQLLVAKKIQLSDQKSTIDAELAKEKAAKPPDPDKVATLTRQSSEAATRLGLVDSAIAAIDTFTAAVRTVPSGGKRAPLASAALHEGLHGPQPRFSHVLLVKAQAGQAQQTVDNRPLLFDDKYSTLADTSVTYMLIETHESEIINAATVTGTASARGDIGERPTVDAFVENGAGRT